MWDNIDKKDFSEFPGELGRKIRQILEPFLS